MDRLSGETQKRRRAAGRHQPSAILVEQRDQPRIATGTIRFSHCQTIVA
jgi:hypothetical protein